MTEKCILEKRKKFVHQIDQVPDWHLTMYDKEYGPKTGKREPPYLPDELLLRRMGVKRPDPLTYPFQQSLLPDYEIDSAPNKDEYERGSDFYEKTVERKPSIVLLVDEPVDQRVLDEEHQLYNYDRSVYQVDYCQLAAVHGPVINADVVPSSGKKRVVIPDRWKPTPLTVYRQDFRDHYGLAKWKLTRDPVKPPKNNLDSNPEERALFKEKSGVSEYEGVIGELGHHIITDEYHGKVPPLPGQFSENELKPKK